MKKISSIIFSIALICCFLPVRVFAENNSTYYVGTNECTNVLVRQGEYINVSVTNNNSEVRLVAINYISSNNYRTIIYAFSNSSFILHWGQNACGSSRGADYSSQFGKYMCTSDFVARWYTTYNMPSYIESDYSSIGNTQQIAYYFTYGAGAVDPEPEVTFGDLIDVGYNTKIAGSGDAAINNLDTISWNPEQDANGNDISDMSVTIRAVPGKYSAQTSQSILEQLYSNFVLDTLHVSELDTVNASDGSFSVSWNDVVHEFDLLGIPGFWFATKDTVKDPEGGYIKRGWIYQIRLEGEDYTGDWQTVYTSTSSGVSNDLTIINSSTINQTLINSITEINNLNSTENNWYINNTTINMGEYSDPGSSGKPWWAYLLEAIVSLLNGVIDAIANLVGSLIDGLLGLFSFDSFSIPDFTTNKQTIKQNSGIFGESIDLLQGINSTLSNADGTAEPILYYPGLELMGEEFIPEITINLNTYVSDLGLTEWHNLAYVCTDAMIWISLIYTIYRKLIGVFKK